MQRPGGTVDQLHPHPLLQLRDDLAGGGLGDLVGRRRLREGAVAGHVAEQFQGFKLHRHILAAVFLISSVSFIIFLNTLVKGGRAKQECLLPLLVPTLGVGTR